MLEVAEQERVFCEPTVLEPFSTNACRASKCFSYCPCSWVAVTSYVAVPDDMLEES